MQYYIAKISPHATLILRIFLAFVVIWFGTNEVLHPEAWTGFIPSWITSMGFNAVTLVYINGIAEIVLGLLLAAGIFTRVVAALLFLHMATIVIEVGINPIGVRDIGLAGAFLYLALCEHNKFSKNNSNEQIP